MIMDWMGVRSPVQHGVVMKGAQIGLTAAAENVIAYWMDEKTDALLGKWATKRLEPLIDSCGFRKKIRNTSGNSKSRRTGDKTFSKQFIGGSLEMSSAQSGSGLRSDSVRLLIRDEMDGAPPLLKSGEGRWDAVSYARTNAFGQYRKILDFSTPTIVGQSLIYQNFLEGDQCYYFVPCPFCGKMQQLKWDIEHAKSSIFVETTAGKKIDVYYGCEYCGEAIRNAHKYEILAKGEWRPSTTAEIPNKRSAQISTMYSPVGMSTWTDMYAEYQKAQKDPDGMRSFTNLYLGEPYEDKGARPDPNKVMQLRSGYRSGEVPDGVLFLTMAVDVQVGSVHDRRKPPRLELEVLGHGAGYKTWSIDYKQIIGRVDVPAVGAWVKLDEYANKTKLLFTRKSDGLQFKVMMVFFDSGVLTPVVYRAAESWGNTFPSKGYGALTRRKFEHVDPTGPMDFKKYRPATLPDGRILYEISTIYYKNHVYSNLKVKRREGVGEQAPGFCEFPVDYDANYFKMLTAEERLPDGSYDSKGRPNEALDLRVMNLCAGDAWLDSEVRLAQLDAKERGLSKSQISQITTRAVIDQMVQQILKK
jgi:phage terminase large subunit GpA-like protein